MNAPTMAILLRPYLRQIGDRDQRLAVGRAIAAAHADGDCRSSWRDICSVPMRSDVHHCALGEIYRVLASLGAELPACWCGCGEPPVGWESEGGDVAATGCRDYAVDAEGDAICGCDPRVVDEGHWVGNGWVSRLVVREAGGAS